MGWQYINIDHNTHCWSVNKDKKNFQFQCFYIIGQHNQISYIYFLVDVSVLAVN